MLQELCFLHYLLLWSAHMRSDLRSHFIERQLQKAVALVGGKLVYLVLQEVEAELSTELWVGEGAPASMGDTACATNWRTAGKSPIHPRGRRRADCFLAVAGGCACNHRDTCGPPMGAATALSRTPPAQPPEHDADRLRPGALRDSSCSETALQPRYEV